MKLMKQKKKGGKIRCLLLLRKKKNVYLLFMMSFKNSPVTTTCVCVCLCVCVCVFVCVFVCVYAQNKEKHKYVTMCAHISTYAHTRRIWCIGNHEQAHEQAHLVTRTYKYVRTYPVHLVYWQSWASPRCVPAWYHVMLWLMM